MMLPAPTSKSEYSVILIKSSKMNNKLEREEWQEALGDVEAI